MTVSQSFLSFVLATLILALTPGLDTALVLRTALRDGRGKGVETALGIACGCLAWGVAAATGLGALLAASRLAFDMIRACGAAYLLWAGVRMLLRPRSDMLAPDTARRGLPRRHFLRGLCQNLLNPKIGVFYISFLPQFVPAHVRVGPYLFVLSGVQAGVSLLWLVVVACMGHSLARLLCQGATARLMDRLTGCVFIGFGLRLGLSRH
ncbi:LysE family translocator [Komagataeibacter sucrofermentans]|uniref:Lysine transporter LysE n=1 Tax=Komagataeibacter sucrofermentans TaxID=1053551 RepID=A0A318QTD9_9PROT|nr:LysE family translocator [Komagataeibacter sucrofermentans]PYD81204.1 lysine transporter LysE [Komagataeibacter sucrofermentans]GBQ44903.1 amino acid efflux protein [Komagataeibacter sucrofermentans DSM 15973]